MPLIYRLCGGRCAEFTAPKLWIVSPAKNHNNNNNKKKTSMNSLYCLFLTMNMVFRHETYPPLTLTAALREAKIARKYGTRTQHEWHCVECGCFYHYEMKHNFNGSRYPYVICHYTLHMYYVRTNENSCTAACNFVRRRMEFSHDMYSVRNLRVWNGT